MNSSVSIPVAGIATLVGVLASDLIRIIVKRWRNRGGIRWLKRKAGKPRFAYLLRSAEGQTWVNVELIWKVTDNGGTGAAPTTIHFIGGQTITVNEGWSRVIDELRRNE